MVAARAIRQVRAATGPITQDLFALKEVALPDPGPGELAVRVRMISVDPYLVMRLREGFPAGAIRSRVIGMVERSRAAGFEEGDVVIGFAHWQDRVVVNADAMRVLKPRAPLAAYLGVIGHSGFTATLGVDLLDLKAGQTFTVSSAAGMVGLVAGQLAMRAGARVVGIASGAKAQALVDRLGFAAGIDYRKGDIVKHLRHAAPAGIDRHFENVGATMLDPVLACANAGARIALCGMIAHYADHNPICFSNFKMMMSKEVTISGFNIANHTDRYQAGLARLESLYLEGEIKGFEVMHQGLESLPDAMIAMLAGDGFGKHVVQL